MSFQEIRATSSTQPLLLRTEPTYQKQPNAKLVAAWNDNKPTTKLQAAWRGFCNACKSLSVSLSKTASNIQSAYRRVSGIDGDRSHLSSPKLTSREFVTLALRDFDEQTMLNSISKCVDKNVKRIAQQAIPKVYDGSSKRSNIQVTNALNQGTMLNWNSDRRNIPVITALIEAGAKMHVYDRNGQTYIDWIAPSGTDILVANTY